MQTTPDIPDDEISLYDFWRVLIRRKAWVLGFPLFAIIAAAITVTFMKQQWEALALIRIGEVAQVEQGDGDQVRKVGQRLIEPVAQAVERIKLKSFKEAVLINIGLPTDNRDSFLYLKTLQVKNLRGVDLIELKVRGYSQASAMRFVDATINHLKKSHDERAGSEMQLMRQTLERTEKLIAQTKAERDKLIKLMDLSDKAGFMESVVLTNNIIKLDEILRSLNQAKADNVAQLGPTNTFPTSAIEKISLSDEPVAPKKVLIILMAGVFGLLAGVGAAFLDHARTRRNIGNAV